MKKLKPIEKAIFTFTLIGLESKDPEEKKLLIKIAAICEDASQLDNPLKHAGRNLSLMLATEELTTDQKASVLSAIDVLEKIQEQHSIINN